MFMVVGFSDRKKKRGEEMATCELLCRTETSAKPCTQIGVCVASGSSTRAETRLVVFFKTES